jgi:ABC-type sugar transport system permease subunit
MVIVIAIVFRSQRWPLTRTLFGIGFTGLSYVSLYSSIIFLIKFNHQKFLKYIGFSSSIILSGVAIGLLWKNMHWPGSNILLTVGLVTFIPFLFAFLFTLPGSDYINWQKSDRTVFFRAVVVPMIFVYTLCVLMFVIPDLWQSLTRLPLTPFGMEPVELLDKAGLH